MNVPISIPERPVRERKPDWIRVKAPTGAVFNETRKLMRDLSLNTVCEEAACPNIGECWTKKHATVMILGDVCTRACAQMFPGDPSNTTCINQLLVFASDWVVCILSIVHMI